MKTIHLMCFLMFGLLLPQVSGAQQATVRGQVADAKTNESLPGVSVVIKGTTTGTITDVNGNYQISAGTNAVLVFSYVGMTSQEIQVGGKTVINVLLQPESFDVEQVVVVGYGTQKKANLTGAVANIDVEQTLASRPITDVGRALQGATPGLIITTTQGNIGSAPTINMRGMTGSLNSAATPLILLDNVPIPDLNYVNPEDIESISVLKDAASSAIYGARAAFGVVLITSKSGKKGENIRVSYTNNFAFSTPANLPEMATAWESGLAYLTAARHDNKSTQYVGTIGGLRYNDDIIVKMKAWSELYGRGEGLSREMERGRDFEMYVGYMEGYRDWDVQKLFFSEWTPQTSHNLAVSGGSKTISYNISLGTLGQTGIFKPKPDSYDRYNINASINSDINKWLSVRLRTQLTKSLLKTPFSLSGGTYTPLFTLYRWQPSYFYGTFQGYPFRNPVNEYEQAKYMDKDIWYNRYSLGTTIRPIKGLSIDVDYTYNTNFETNSTVGGIPSALDIYTAPTAANVADPTTMYKAYTTSYDYVSEDLGRTVGYVLNSVVTYETKIADHFLKVMGGTNIEASEYKYHWSQRKGVLDYTHPEIALSTGDQFVSGAHSKSALAGFFGRLNYIFKDKYILELNGRYDGTSRFFGENQWGFFPSASIGYRISEEPFFEPLKKYINSLKPRISWGSIGNQNVPSGQFLSSIAVGTSSWLIGNKTTSYAGVPSTLNPVLTWETVQTLDIGLDARLLNDKIGLTGEWFQRKTLDMLGAGQVVPSSFGASSPMVNYGELTTKGWEVVVDFNHTFKNGFHILLSANVSDYLTKITKFASASDPVVTSNYEGKVLGEIWGFETDRLFQETDFTLNTTTNKWVLNPGIPKQTKLESSSFTYAPGDIKFKDLNNDSTIYYGLNTLSDHGDLKVIGNEQPRFLYGFRVAADWKGFDLDIFLQGVGKREYWATGNTTIPGFDQTEAWYAHQMDYWTPENTDAFYPRPANSAQVNNVYNFRIQTKYLQNLAYTRLKNVTFGYTLPPAISKKVSIQKLRIYASGENLFEIDKLGVVPIDPEVGMHSTADARMYARGYPYHRTVSFGMQLTF
jgi:TonB-linked SusC/RagA family outer membrane protein